jgi:hypothetical protein
MATGTRAWSRPELVVLVHRRSEEAVLNSCKDEVHHPDPGDRHCGCLGVLAWPCAICSILMHS